MKISKKLVNGQSRLRYVTKKLEPNDPQLKKLLEAFDEAAKVHGWEEDQGTGKDVDNAAETYLKTRNALVRKLNAPKILHVLMSMHQGRDQARAIFTSEKLGEEWAKGRTFGDGMYFEEYQLDPEAD